MHIYRAGKQANSGSGSIRDMGELWACLDVEIWDCCLSMPLWGVPVSPFLLIQTAGPHTPNLLRPSQGRKSPCGPIYGSGLPFCWLNCKLLYLPLQSSNISHNKGEPVPRRWVVRESAHRAKEENWNFFWKMLRPQPDPDRDASCGTMTGEGMQLHCSHKQSCKSEMFETDKRVTWLRFSTHGQPSARGRRLRASPTSGRSEDPGRLANMQTTWPHPSSVAEGETPGCPGRTFSTNLDFHARPGGGF